MAAEEKETLSLATLMQKKTAARAAAVPETDNGGQHGGRVEGGATVGGGADAGGEEGGLGGGCAGDGDRVVLETVGHLTAAAQTLQT